MTEVNGASTLGDVFEAKKWKYLNQILAQPGAFLTEEYRAAYSPDSISKSKILVIGAGGLGCEILKNLALSGFKDIHVIDMDTIDVSNLNRQFLFRASDVGSPKASVAAAFVEKRVKGVKIAPYVGKIQDKDEDYYMQFDLIICGLDSIEARRWINEMLVGMVDMENPASLKPLVDGGTEGFKGQARVILPTLTSCIECQLDMHAPRAAVPLCTIATIPRQPSHCIEWASQIAWPADRRDETLDTDDPSHITWLYTRAAERAASYGIGGVTYALTQGVVKNIIPAIASTNAIVAASCCNEAFKILSGCNATLGMPVPGENNYMMYTGDDGVYTYTFSHERKPDCPVCGSLARGLEVRRSFTLEEFLEQLRDLPDAQLSHPSISMGERSLYYAAGPLQESTKPNLKRKLADMVGEGEEVAVTDPAYQTSFRFRLSFRD